MGTTHVDVTVTNPQEPVRNWVGRFLVDTGASIRWYPGGISRRSASSRTDGERSGWPTGRRSRSTSPSRGSVSWVNSVRTSWFRRGRRRTAAGRHRLGDGRDGGRSENAAIETATDTAARSNVPGNVPGFQAGGRGPARGGWKAPALEPADRSSATSRRPGVVRSGASVEMVADVPSLNHSSPLSPFARG